MSLEKKQEKALKSLREKVTKGKASEESLSEVRKQQQAETATFDKNSSTKVRLRLYNYTYLILIYANESKVAKICIRVKICHLKVHNVQRIYSHAQYICTSVYRVCCVHER